MIPTLCRNSACLPRAKHHPCSPSRMRCHGNVCGLPQRWKKTWGQRWWLVAGKWVTRLPSNSYPMVGEIPRFYPMKIPLKLTALSSGKRLQFANWKITFFLLGKSTISTCYGFNRELLVIARGHFLCWNIGLTSCKRLSSFFWIVFADRRRWCWGILMGEYLTGAFYAGNGWVAGGCWDDLSDS